MIQIVRYELGIGIEANLAPIGGQHTRFYYKCCHFAPDHLRKGQFKLMASLDPSRSGKSQCVKCLGR